MLALSSLACIASHVPDNLYIELVACPSVKVTMDNVTIVHEPAVSALLLCGIAAMAGAYRWFINKSFCLRLNRWPWPCLLVVLLADFASPKSSAATNILAVTHITVNNALGRTAPLFILRSSISSRTIAALSPSCWRALHPQIAAATPSEETTPSMLPRKGVRRVSVNEIVVFHKRAVSKTKKVYNLID